MAIHFTNTDTSFKLKNASLLKTWIKKIILAEKKELGKIYYVFLNDDELLKYNKKFLKHNTYTDIITFDYSSDKKLSAEIFISTERVRDNANKLSVPFEEELHRVMIHGILHLCGYKDKSKEAKLEMRKKEESALKKLVKHFPK
ncbi:MAG: rRNA maturation RNase YbeY [Sphingobacteriaceae bacterium]|nr:rRNA maturation RNase YbeY [Sphingobacteriaceae bacterium]